MDRAATSSRRRCTRPGCRWTPRRVVVLVEGVLAGVAGVHLATGSIAVTVVAAAVAVTVLTLVAWMPR